jgi:hypothetical protein
VADAKPEGVNRVGAFFSVKGCVTGNGQFTGTVTSAELSHINCSRCLKTLARLKEVL